MVRADPAAAEYARLVEALDLRPAPCRDFSFFTDDDPPSEQVAFALRICAGCPIRALCADYAEASNPGCGIWAGRQYPIRKTKNNG